MNALQTRLACLAFLLALSATAQAGEPIDFNAAVSAAAAHNSAAIDHLRAGNSDLAALEIDRTREAWGAVTSRFGRPPDAPAIDRQLYTTTLLDVSLRLVTASIMLNSGRAEAARASLDAINTELVQLSKTNGASQ